jgi:hypothetical protein
VGFHTHTDKVSRGTYVHRQRVKAGQQYALGRGRCFCCYYLSPQQPESDLSELLPVPHTIIGNEEIIWPVDDPPFPFPFSPNLPSTRWFWAESVPWVSVVALCERPASRISQSVPHLSGKVGHHGERVLTMASGSPVLCHGYCHCFGSPLSRTNCPFSLTSLSPLYSYATCSTLLRLPDD